jgi:hypothetical protein
VDNLWIGAYIRSAIVIFWQLSDIYVIVIVPYIVDCEVDTLLREIINTIIATYRSGMGKTTDWWRVWLIYSSSMRRRTAKGAIRKNSYAHAGNPTSVIVLVRRWADSGGSSPAIPAA